MNIKRKDREQNSKDKKLLMNIKTNRMVLLIKKIHQKQKKLARRKSRSKLFRKRLIRQRKSQKRLKIRSPKSKRKVVKEDNNRKRLLINVKTSEKHQFYWKTAICLAGDLQVSSKAMIYKPMMTWYGELNWRNKQRNSRVRKRVDSNLELIFDLKKCLMSLKTNHWYYFLQFHKTGGLYS